MKSFLKYFLIITLIVSVIAGSALFGSGVVGYSEGSVVLVHRHAKIKDIQAFLDKNNGVVKVRKAWWERHGRWKYEVSGYMSERIMPAVSAGEPEPGEFWTATRDGLKIVLVEKTKCP